MGYTNSQKNKSIGEMIKDSMLIFGLVGSLYLWQVRDQTLQREAMEIKEPIKIEYKDVNRDGIADRIISYKKGKDQIQFGINKSDGTIEYLTLNQIKDKETKRLGEVLSKYNIKNQGDVSK